MIFGPHDPPISRANRISSHEAGTLQSSQTETSLRRWTIQDFFSWHPKFDPEPPHEFRGEMESCGHAARPASGATVTRFPADQPQELILATLDTRISAMLIILGKSMKHHEAKKGISSLSMEDF